MGPTLLAFTQTNLYATPQGVLVAPSILIAVESIPKRQRDRVVDAATMLVRPEPPYFLLVLDGLDDALAGGGSGGKEAGEDADKEAGEEGGEGR